VLEARRSNSKPDLGIVKFRNEITNQAGEPMAVSECTVLFRCREKGQA
jgi:acyl dehydratase